MGWAEKEAVWCERMRKSEGAPLMASFCLARVDRSGRSPSGMLSWMLSGLDSWMLSLWASSFRLHIDTACSTTSLSGSPPAHTQMDRPAYTRKRSSNPASPLLVARRATAASGASSSSSGAIPMRPRSNSRNRSRSRTRRASGASSTTTDTGPSLLSPATAAHEVAHHHPHSHHSHTSVSRAGSVVSLDNVLNVNLDNSLPLDYFKQDILSVLKALRIPKWRKISKSNYKAIHLDRISGAMTNCVYKMTYHNYYPLLLRIYGDVENIIDRNSELLTLIRLSRKNIGPKLLGCFNNGRFEEFLNNSITLNKSQLRDPKISRMIARRMKEFHYGVNLNYDEYNSGPKAWLLIERWISVVDKLIENSSAEDQKNVFILNWADSKKLIISYRDYLYSTYGNVENLKESLRFCHNDTQYGNLLFYSKSESMPISDGDDDDGDGDGDGEEEGDHHQTQADDEEVLIDDSEITSLSLSNQMDQLSLKHHPTAMSLSDSINKDTPLPIVTDTNFKYDTRLTVIDFEYAGQNPPAYDITNHFSEWMYDYHDPQFNYKTDESKYPSVEERINYLNSYAQYVPGSSTPNLKPISSSSSSVYSLSTPTAASSSFVKHPSAAAAPPPPLKQSRSVVSIKLADLPPSVTHLYNETIYWRSTSSIFWALWAIISRGSIDTASNEHINNNNNNNAGKSNSLDFKTPKFEIGPNGEQYKIIVDEIETMNENESGSDDEFLKPTLDDEFDHQKYALGKIGIFIGDMIQFGLLKKEAIDTDRLKDIKFLDTELLPLTDA